MPDPQRISDLEIIGYATTLADETLPAIVPPVFRLRAAQDRVFLPPFVMKDGCLCDAAERSQAEVQALASAREVTLFEAPLQAERDFELWIDLERQAHYERIPDAAGKLRSIARENVQKAKASLQRSNLADAQRFARIALCADENRIDSLAISAAVSHLQGNATGVAGAARFAETRIAADGFNELVRSYSSLASSTPKSAIEPDLFAKRPMREMALQKAA